MPRQRKLEIVQHKNGEWYHPVRHLVAKKAGRKLKHQERNRRMAQAGILVPTQPEVTPVVTVKQSMFHNWVQRLKRLFI